MFELTGTVLAVRSRTAQSGKEWVDVYVEVPGRSSVVQAFASVEDLKGDLPMRDGRYTFACDVSAQSDRFTGGARLSVKIVEFSPALASAAL